MNAATLAANRTLEESGYFTVAWSGDPRNMPCVGDKMDTTNDGIEGPLFVLAPGTRGEYIEQNRRYNPGGLLQASINADHAVAFFRLVAE